MHFGLCTISNLDADAETVIRLAAEAGYSGVELCGRDPYAGDRSAAHFRELAACAAANDIEVPVYGSYLRPGTDSFADELERALTATNALGAPLIRVWAGEQEYQETTDEHWDRTVEDLGTLADAAADRGIEVTVERHAGTLTNTAEGATQLVEALDRENCQLNYQPNFGHSADEVVADVQKLARISNHAHIQATAEPGVRDRCLLEAGYFDVGAVLVALADADFDGYVAVEFVTDAVAYETAIRRDLEYLESIRP